jgi:Asp/Glu/hydantoin racemase
MGARTKRRVALVHAAPAALPPLLAYYAEAAPDLDLVNLLDDGLQRLFALDEAGPAEHRLLEMIAAARDAYAAELALLTCSAVRRSTVEALRAAAGVPVLKIDEPMARAAVRAGRRLGVIVTFPPTVESTRRLLLDADPNVELAIELVDGNWAIPAAAERLAARPVDAVVLAQVSMAPLAAGLRARLPVPVFTSLETSLAAVREALAQVDVRRFM